MATGSKAGLYKNAQSVSYLPPTLTQVSFSCVSSLGEIWTSFSPAPMIDVGPYKLAVIEVK